MRTPTRSPRRLGHDLLRRHRPAVDRGHLRDHRAGFGRRDRRPPATGGPTATAPGSTARAGRPGRTSPWSGASPPSARAARPGLRRRPCPAPKSSPEAPAGGRAAGSGRYSAYSEKSSGSAPPRPKPARNRNSMSHSGLGANAAASPNTENSRDRESEAAAAGRSGRRTGPPEPSRRASIPTKPAVGDADRPGDGVEAELGADRRAARTRSRSTSAASAAHVTHRPPAIGAGIGRNRSRRSPLGRWPWPWSSHLLVPTGSTGHTGYGTTVTGHCSAHQLEGEGADEPQSTELGRRAHDDRVGLDLVGDPADLRVRVARRRPGSRPPSPWFSGPPASTMARTSADGLLLGPPSSAPRLPGCPGPATTG